MTRRVDRRARRGRKADALSAFAGAVGQQPHPQGDEPQPHGRNLSRVSSRKCAPRGPTSPFPATSSSAFPARPKRISKRRCRSSMRCATPRPIRSNIAPARALRRRAMEDQIPREIMDDRLQRLQARIDEHQLAFNRSKIGVDTAGPDRAQGPARRPDDRPLARGFSRSMSTPTRKPGEIVDVTLVARGTEQHDRRRAPEGGRLMARRDLAAVPPTSRARPARDRVRAALSARARCSATTTAT